MITVVSLWEHSHIRAGSTDLCHAARETVSEMRETMSAQKWTAGKMRQKGMVMTDTPKYTTAATDVKLIDILHAEQNTLKARISALEAALVKIKAVTGTSTEAWHIAHSAINANEVKRDE